MPTISAIALATLNIQAYAGDTLQMVFTFLQSDNVTPINISSYGFVMEIKKDQLSAPSLRLQLGSGLLIGGTSSNQLTINSPINLKGGNYFYDIEATLPDTSKITYVGGTFTLTQDTTNSTIES